MDGTPIIMPGLEPEHILAGLEDEREGRMINMTDYLRQKREERSERYPPWIS